MPGVCVVGRLFQPRIALSRRPGAPFRLSSHHGLSFQPRKVSHVSSSGVHGLPTPSIERSRQSVRAGAEASFCTAGLRKGRSIFCGAYATAAGRLDRHAVRHTWPIGRCWATGSHQVLAPPESAGAMEGSRSSISRARCLGFPWFLSGEVGGGRLMFLGVCGAETFLFLVPGSSVGRGRRGRGGEHKALPGSVAMSWRPCLTFSVPKQPERWERPRELLASREYEEEKKRKRAPRPER